MLPLITLRLQNQLLVQPPFDAPQQVVEWMGAVQAQDYRMAKWAVGCRTASTDATQIEAALNRGDILRTHLLRPTWHFVSSKDLRWMLSLTADRIRAANDSYARGTDAALDSKSIHRYMNLLQKTLEGNKHRTKEEIGEALNQRGIPLSQYALRHLLMRAETDGIVCTTKANSAILHAGYDPEPGTRMARLNVEGSALAKEICARLDVPYLQCGSLVLALSPEELPHLQKLYENGIANGVPGIRLLSAEETFAMEPNLAPTVVGALYAPSAAIVSPWEFALAMAEVAVRNGVELHRSCPVTHIEKTAGGWALTTPSGIVETRYIINAAGISAQAVHDMAAPHKFTIQPTRGEYYLLDKSEGSRVHHVIFQCPNENGKGVLVAPTVHGNLIVGPNADPVEGDDTACTAAGLAFVSAAARRSVPNIRFSESIRNFAGVRANVDTGDFVIGEAEGAPGFIDLAGMKSPGLSSAPAVAREAVKILEAHGDLPTPKADYRDGRTRVRFKELPPEEKARLIAKEPAYGRVICRCETITEGEILDALHEEIPATTIDGVKRRCGAGMGRCQGGFCGPRVLELISKTLGIDPLDVLQDKAGTNVLLCETKTGRGCNHG